MEKTDKAKSLLNSAFLYAANGRREFVTPEHILLIVTGTREFRNVARHMERDVDNMRQVLVEWEDKMEQIPEEIADCTISPSEELMWVLQEAEKCAREEDDSKVGIAHIVMAIYKRENTKAGMLLRAFFQFEQGFYAHLLGEFNDTDEDDLDSNDNYDAHDEEDYSQEWRQLVTCISDLVEEHNPLIGREAELERTIQVLCRKEKNNPLHIGEPGVGKTSLVYGLAERIARGNVPERLKGSRIYQVDLGSLVAGTQFRGDFERRIEQIMEGLRNEGNAIVYIDEIHNLVGVGATGEGSLDGANMLKPYLEAGTIRFIGSTTYKEFNRYFQKSQGLVRRFQQIDIPEPSRDECISILEGLKDRYEKFHGVRYDKDVIPYVVDMSKKFINDRFLPDKAIDLMDEAGAWRQLHPVMRAKRNSPGIMVPQKTQPVDKKLISDVLCKICKVSVAALQESNDDSARLENLSERVSSQIYGQDEAVQKVCDAVLMGKAGLLEDQKPIASMLFVGPTGVGKTELCRVLAQELGLELVRFDMSEYAEKHTVAKLIGSPAGYVGYEDGGLLTDAIRKTPNCVLLLDELEKAHQDIYNILLQVMDYARLTDNKGQKADFRHVVLVMTSNAGAQFASQAGVGFGSKVSRGDAMLGTVKKTFKPEFLNRLSATVVFNDMDQRMAEMIFDKKLRQLADRLRTKGVELTLTDAARQMLLKKGYTTQYGAREMDRIINSMLTPLLTRAVLFGSLKKGGKAVIDVKGNELEMI